MTFFEKLGILLEAEHPLLQAIYAGDEAKVALSNLHEVFHVTGFNPASTFFQLTPLRLAVLSANPNMPRKVLSLYPKTMRAEMLAKQNDGFHGNLLTLAAHSGNEQMPSAVLQMYVEEGAKEPSVHSWVKEHIPEGERGQWQWYEEPLLGKVAEFNNPVGLGALGKLYSQQALFLFAFGEPYSLNSFVFAATRTGNVALLDVALSLFSDKIKLKKHLDEKWELMVFYAIRSESFSMFQKVLSLYPESQTVILQKCGNQLAKQLVESLLVDDPRFLREFLALYTEDERVTVCHPQSQEAISLPILAGFLGHRNVFNLIMTTVATSSAHLRHILFRIEQRYSKELAYDLDKEGVRLCYEEMVSCLYYATHLQSHFYTGLESFFYGPVCTLQDWLNHIPPKIKEIIYYWKIIEGKSYQQYEIERGNIDWITERLEESSSPEKIEREVIAFGQPVYLQLANARLLEERNAPALDRSVETTPELLQTLLRQSEQLGPYQKSDKKIILRNLIEGKYCVDDESPPVSLWNPLNWFDANQDTLTPVKMGQVRLIYGPMSEACEKRTWALIALYALDLNNKERYLEYVQKLVAANGSHLPPSQFSALLASYFSHSLPHPVLPSQREDFDSMESRRCEEIKIDLPTQTLREEGFAESQRMNRSKPI